MARHAEDREDLLRDATALVPRILLRLEIFGESCEVFAGFRGGALSLYFNADPVYHFNSAHFLRRAFVNGSIVKADGGQLCIMNTVRTDDAVTMNSRRLTAEEAEQLCSEAARQIDGLQAALASCDFEVVGQVPADADVVVELKSTLGELANVRVAAAANVM